MYAKNNVYMTFRDRVKRWRTVLISLAKYISYASAGLTLFVLMFLSTALFGIALRAVEGWVLGNVMLTTPVYYVLLRILWVYVSTAAVGEISMQKYAWLQWSHGVMILVTLREVWDWLWVVGGGTRSMMLAQSVAFGWWTVYRHITTNL